MLLVLSLFRFTFVAVAAAGDDDPNPAPAFFLAAFDDFGFVFFFEEAFSSMREDAASPVMCGVSATNAAVAW